MSRPAPDLLLTNEVAIAEAAFDCCATAALMRAMEPLVWASHVGAVVAAIHFVWFPLLAWCLVIYFALRVHLDAELLEMLSCDPQHAPARLDVWLARAGLRASAGNRSISDRCQGARRLVRYLTAACLLQSVATAAFLLVSYR